MAKNHYVTKRNRRNKNKNRKDWTAETMHALGAAGSKPRFVTVNGVTEELSAWKARTGQA